ncbi:PLxRFG domain-containing protein [Aeromonas hydrophila]|uniref:PLxRFG domain-containing protein n=1 Tax=Aeromonas hydrophila TaxID=644 RepID=UPI0021F4BA7F|nr:PLxRFG domain-containing protein [Aeromonas hydrophila]MCV9380503.1 PLxRFG domain-containing protein [Aeromonas hydrophila]
MDKPGLRDALPQPRQSDTRNDPFWSSLDSSLSAAAAATPQPSEPVAKRDLDVGLGDVARGVGAGALDLVGGIGELARQASNFGKENAGKQGGDYLEQARANMANKLSPLLDVVAGAGDLAASGAESLNDGMSADAKEALGRRLVDETPEGRLTLGDGAGDIDVWAMKMAQGVGSLLPTLAAGGVTGVAAKASIGRAVTASMVKRGATQEVAEAVAAKAVSKIATGAAVTTGATGSVGSAGVNTRDTVLGMSFDELSRSDTFRQAFTRIDQDQQTQHLSDEEKLSLAREETANVASRATMSDAKVWGAAAVGSMMGDAMLFKMLAGKAATGGVLKGTAKGAVGEGIGETLEEGVQQYAINESLNEVAAADIDPMKGVMSSAIEGGLIGMGTGGALGGMGGLRGSKSQPESEGGAQVDPATVEDVAPVESGDPVQVNPAVSPADPDLAPAADAMADQVVAPSGEQSPLGPSASQFDELRDVPDYLRRDDTAERFKGMAADSEVQRALAGEFGQSVQELVASQMQAGDQGKSLYERAQAGELGLDPFAGNKSAQQVAMENQRLALPLKDVIFAGDANAKPKGEAVAAPGDHDDQQAGPGPQFRGGERTRWQSGQEGDVLPPEASSTKPAGELPGAVIEGEASEVGNELPHRNVVYGNDLRAEQQRAADLARRERELNNQPLQIGQSETLFAGGTPGADPRNSAYTPPRLSRDQVDTSMGEQSTRDPRSPVAQSIEQAGSATDSVFGPLKSLRITRKGKPFATEKEAAMASRKGQEMPVPLNGGGFGVAAIGEVQQAQAQQGAVKQPSSNSAQQDRQDGKTEIAQNGMVIVHGSGNPGMSEQDIQIVRASGQKQGKNGRVYGGFYGTSEQDAHQAQAYADMMGGTPTLYDVKIKPGTKVLHKQGDITRLSESYINELVSQGYGVVTGTDPRGQTEHVVIDKSAVASMAPRGAQATPSQVNDTNVADIRQPSDQPAASVSAETVPAPSATAGEASQLAPAIDTGYREVIPVKQPKTEVSNEPVTPVPAISSEGQRDQPGAGEPAAAGAGPAVAGLTDRAGSGDRADLAAPAPVPDGQQQDDQTLTAPATDAGVAVSEVAQPDPVVPAPVAAPTPWAEAIDNPDGTITLKGDVPLIKQWAKDSGVKAIPGKGGLVVSTTSVAKVRQLTTPATSEPVRQIEAARAEIAPEPTEAQKEAGNYKKGHIKLQGLDIALENPKGSTRSGTDQDGKAWQSTMTHDYGYIKRTLGADGDHVDVFIGDKPDSETVYVVDQVDPKTGKFDEHKVMMGFADEQAAREGYLGNYEAGWKGLGAIKAMPVESFKRWVKGGDTMSPIAAQPVAGTVNSVRFSKQAMAQGDKPIKHLTRKEAELVSRGWFKQYRGASGVKVQIHATQGELEGALGLEAKEGLIRRAAFDDDAGTLHVAADTISDPKRMREILRHEVLAHYGLANVLGDGEYTKLMSRLIGSQKDPSMKPVWDWVNTHYADEDIGTKAEEVVAHLAELEQGAWGRGWDQVVAWVTRALRAVGFVPDGITAAETRSLIEGLGKQLQRTGQDDGGSGGKKFSQEEKPGEDTFKPYPGEAEEYRRQLGKMMASPKSGELVIEMGRTPLVLQAVGAPDLPLRITRDIVRKATNGVKHDVPMPVIEQLPELLHDPIAVFDSKTEQGAKTILIDARDASGRPIITAVHLNAKAGRIDINRIASVYGKDNGIGAMERWIDEGLLRYAREKQNPLGTTQGLQLPKRGSPERVYDSNILTKDDIRKGGIKMSQSVADNSPSLEQSITQKAKYQAGAALGSVKNYIKQGRPLMLGTLTDLQIDQVYRDITGGAVSQYQRLRTQMEADRNDILLDAETRIDPLWDALGKQEKADLSNLMHDATMARLHPDKSLDENSYYLEAKQKVERAKKPETKAAYEAELHIIERNHSELARQYNALPANAKALYDTMQDTYTKQWESLRGAIEQRLEDLLGVNQGRAMAAEMRQKMEHALQHGPYFPLTRYGDYVVKARKGDEYVREHFERRADAEQAVKQYQRDGYNAVMTVKEEGGGDSANANQLGMEMLSFLDSADGVSKSALKDEIWQAMLRMMPDASYAKHAIHRRRVKGASRDAHRAYLNSVYHYARHVSKIRYGHKMQGELDKLSEQIRAGVAGEPSSLKPEDLEIAQQVLNEMNKRHDLNMNPTGKAWAGSAGNIGFLYYIGPSVASAVVNMTQNFTVMLPQLGAKYGFAKSAAAMTQALGDYVKHGKFKAGTTEAWHSLTRSTTLPADERAILDRLYRAGALDLTQAHSIAAKADTDQQDAKPMGKRWRRAMRWAGATFHNAEVLNREVAALAAYRLLKQAEPTLNGQQYADRVAEMVYDGHGNYAASNRPRYMRNDITKVLTQFKIYSQMMTYVLYSNAIKAAKGDKVAQKTLAGVLATHWVMAGVMGLPTPITAVVYAIAAGLDDDDDRSGEASFRLALTEALGPSAGELLAKGPMDALTNLSIAGRTGLGDLWWRSPKEGTEGDDLAWHAVQQLLGPVAGIGINLARGAGQMTDGHIQRGLETMLPKSIRDVAKSYRQATEGEQTIKGDIIMDDVSTWNVAMQGLGFGSAQMAKNYDAREYIKGKEKRIADKRSQLLTDYYMARKSGEMDEVQEVLERIKMFNSINHPRERITGKSLALSFKSKLRSNERTQGGVYLNRNREYLREEGRFAD